MNNHKFRPPLHRPDTMAISNKNSRFSNVQCHAYKFFGHTITHCGLLPKVLAIIQFQSKNAKQCDNVLQKYISQNSVSSKKTFVRALQQAQVLSNGYDSDDLMENDLVIHLFHDNDINLESIESSLE